MRRGWFWAEHDEPKTVEHLLAIYYRSVGLGANLLLNVPPDREGRIDPADAAVVRAFGSEVDRRFGAPVAARLDHDAADRVIAELPADTPFDHLWLEEDLVAGQRIRTHRVLLDGAVIAEGSTVGATRIHLVGPQRARRLEIELTGDDPRLLGGAACTARASRTSSRCRTATSRRPTPRTDQWIPCGAQNQRRSSVTRPPSAKVPVTASAICRTSSGA